MTGNDKRLSRNKRDLFELIPGYSCNANCRFCSIEPAKRRVNSGTKEVFRRICEAKREGFKYLGIGGGEPTLRGDLPAILQLSKKLQFDVIRIETNGIALAYRDYCRRLSDCGLDFVKLSVHSAKSKTHDFLTRVPGSFKKVLKAIENIQKLKMRIEINTVINKYNCLDYENFIKFFARMGIGSFVFIYPLYTGSMFLNAKELGVRMKNITTPLKEALRQIELLELDKGMLFNIPFCCYPVSRKLVEMFPFNTKVSAPDSIVESVDLALQKGKVKLPACSQCACVSSCDGIWREYLKIYGPDEFKPLLPHNGKN